MASHSCEKLHRHAHGVLRGRNVISCVPGDAEIVAIFAAACRVVRGDRGNRSAMLVVVTLVVVAGNLNESPAEHVWVFGRLRERNWMLKDGQKKTVDSSGQAGDSVTEQMGSAMAIAYAMAACWYRRCRVQESDPHSIFEISMSQDGARMGAMDRARAVNP